MDELHSEEVVVKTPGYTVVREYVAAGGEITPHTHEHPHVIIPVFGGQVRQLDADGNAVFELDFAKLEPGHILHIGQDRLPLTHSLKNIGTEPWIHIRIDIHDSGDES